MSVGHDDKSTIDLSEVIDLLESLTVQNHDGKLVKFLKGVKL